MPREAGACHLGIRLKRLGINSRSDHIIYMRDDCAVCRAEGFNAQARVRVDMGDRFIIATIHHVNSDLLTDGEASLSERAWEFLDASEGDCISLSHPALLESLRKVRGKIYGRAFEGDDLSTIVRDLTEGRYSDVETAAFITACSAQDLDGAERIALTKAMVDVGDRLEWSRTPVVDKHCIGGLPGNRTTPIIVSIVAANGLLMPKTSSRAITSPAGTADTMEVLTKVDLDLAAIRRVVASEGACLAWGGAVRLSPADDLLIRIERALDIDSDGQLVASVLSKKIAAGATHLVLDIPYGPTAKVRSLEAAEKLKASLLDVAAAFGLKAHAVLSDGTEPVGRGIGPALEARDVLSVLRCEPDAPQDLRDRAITLAGCLLEMAGCVDAGAGAARATATLEDGCAFKKFEDICAAQGGLAKPPVAPHRWAVEATENGRVAGIDNRRIAQVAKLLGAPDAKAAGVLMMARVGDRVEVGAKLYEMHAETTGEMAYAQAYVDQNQDIIAVEVS
ncbi:thymidine phosphorylase family protein [Kordiimonas sp.]|uniref:thymidine phosphorylase family protein n=1 Tax=Kordiimonas sp. TaxID=1970157 RepID=UPI003A944130